MAILSMSSQARFFIIICAAGFVCGFIYDAVRLLRKAVKHSAFAVAAEDVLFWALCAGIVFYAAVTLDSGNVRVFLIGGAFLGMALYFTAASPFLAGIASTIKRLINRGRGG